MSTIILPLLLLLPSSRRLPLSMQEFQRQWKPGCFCGITENCLQDAFYFPSWKIVVVEQKAFFFFSWLLPQKRYYHPNNQEALRLSKKKAFFFLQKKSGLMSVCKKGLTIFSKTLYLVMFISEHCDHPWAPTATPITNKAREKSATEVINTFWCHMSLFFVVWQKLTTKKNVIFLFLWKCEGLINHLKRNPCCFNMICIIASTVKAF